MSAERETVVVVLQYGTKLGILYMASEFYPNGIVGIVEEYGRSRYSLFYAMSVPFSAVRFTDMTPSDHE